MALEVEVEKTDDKFLREVRKVNRAISSIALTSIVLLLARNGASSPGELAARLGKSKFVVSQQLAKLRFAGVVVQKGRAKSRTPNDMRKREYELNSDMLVEIFRQDHALELSLYHNHITFLEKVNLEAKGVIMKTELAILGSGKLGIVREVKLEDDGGGENTPTAASKQLADTRMSNLCSEFLDLLKGYLAERSFSSIREYYVGLYRELAASYRRLPTRSQLALFYEFLDKSMSRIKPIEDLWKRHVGPRKDEAAARTLTTNFPKVDYREGGDSSTLLLFMEAGKTDYAGRYILNSGSQSYIGPGIKTRIYPSFTYMEL